MKKILFGMLYPITAVLVFHFATVSVTWIMEYITQEPDIEWHWTLRLIKVILSISIGLTASITVWDELSRIQKKK